MWHEAAPSVPLPPISQAGGCRAGWDGPHSELSPWWVSPGAGASPGMGCPLQRSIPCSRASPRTGMGVPPGQGAPPGGSVPYNGVSPAQGCALRWQPGSEGSQVPHMPGVPVLGTGVSWPGEGFTSPCLYAGGSEPSCAAAYRVPAGMRAMPRRQGPADPVTRGPLALPIGCHATAQK